MAYLDSEYDEVDPERAEWEVDLFFFRFDTSLLPGAVLAAALIALFLLYLPGGMRDLALSSETVREGRVATLFTHMAAHGGPGHLWMNVAALLVLSRILIRRVGIGARALLACAALLILSGLAGASVYLAIHPYGTVPMLGASGAICGLLGFAARIDPESRALAPLRSVTIGRALVDFAKWNLVLFLALYVLVWSLGGTGGLAWEAHLGGFAVGLLGAPFFLGWASRRVHLEGERSPHADGGVRDGISD
jgi:membrane associated rhomboid family serine protease